MILLRRVLGAALLFGSVSLQAANVRVVVTSKVRQECPAVDTACTKFDDTEFECACFVQADRWKVRTTITSRPVVYLSHTRYMLHEVSHMYDFDSAMRVFARGIEAMSFDERGACEAFAADARQTFPRFIRDVLSESMRLRDPGRR